MNARSAKRNYQLQQWRAIIQERNNSGLTINEYCNQNGLSRNSYFYWLRLIREEVLAPQQSTPDFVELSLPTENDAVFPSVTPMSAPEQKTSQLTLSTNGILIQVTDCTSSDLLARTLEVIRHVK